MKDDTRPLVSICCTTYNHETYIEDAIKGFLMQQVDFPIEILIQDDASTDATAEIVRSYAQKHSGLIKPYYEAENLYSKGVKPLPRLLSRARGSFIAICEGDDFWTEPSKLYKQVRFLESHSDVFVCGHAVAQVDACGNLLSQSKFGIHEDRILSQDDLAYGLGLPTLSVLFRNQVIVPTVDAPNGDTILWAFFSNYGSGFISREVMGVHRVHPGGVWSSRDARARVDALAVTYAVLPSVVHPRRKSLAYCRLLGFSLKRDYRWRRRARNASWAVFMMVRWLRPRAAVYLTRRALGWLFQTMKRRRRKH